MMNQVQKLVMFTGIFTINLSFAQGYKVETEKGVKYINDPMVCNGRHWTEANGKQMLNEFSQLWTDAKSWKKEPRQSKITSKMECNGIKSPNTVAKSMSSNIPKK